MQKIDLFVPGRLCLFGEHSDWAGKYRSMNSALVAGEAIVTGTEQGIYATVEKSDNFEMTCSALSLKDIWQDFECPMNAEALKDVAHSGSFFSYCAGVASYMLEWYNIGGAKIHITDMTLPLKSGLSSSAAICVLVCRAFNELYDLNLSTMGEMNIAYVGELRTASRCGRLDQACAFGVRPVLMNFDGEEIDVTRLNVKRDLHWVFADLNASKDTVKILKDLNKAFPFADNDKEQAIQDALGPINHEIVSRAVNYMKVGDAEALGKLMTEAQQIFDEKVAPMCPSQLQSPVLHQTLSDPKLQSLSFGGKGVGSQGDGSIQFLAKNEECQKQIIEYLNAQGMSAYALTLKAMHSIRKAVIPVAGFGTRLYPATRAMKKDFFPIVDRDGKVKPVILILLEELINSGIEEICLVLGSQEEREEYRKFFETQLADEHFQKLKPEDQNYERHILEIGKRLTYVYQTEKRGFGHAVSLTANFAAGEPVLLMLGDTIYRSNNGKTCTLQFIEAYEKYNKPMVAIHPIPLQDVSHYGIMAGYWDNREETILHMTKFCEKPKVSFAEENLAVKMRNGEHRYYSVFGQYILTPEVYQQLKSDVANAKQDGKEIELTSALDKVRAQYGMYGVQVDGEMFDMGKPDAFLNCITNFVK
jgi:UTP-glucose-1-phosphate uridylyltransferase/mevalonate kinase